MAYTTSNEYKEIIYNGDARHNVKIWFNGIELEEAGRYCEKLTRIHRIMPNDGSKRFSLDNFISQELTIVLHDIDTSMIKDQVEVSIGTLISQNNYEYVPLGMFNIQGTPTTDKNKTTIKLRDNRVKFDFGYNAKPLLDTYGGKATKKQILNDICGKANVISDVISFLGENDEVGIYDNSIMGTTYVSYIAEQAGMTPIINRYGHLQFINYKDAFVHKIPLYLVEKYELGNSFKIERIVYESGIIKYQTSNDKTLDTLYINTANPYVKNQEHINDIFEIINGFEIDSVTTGKILGDPAIDPYDIIEVYGYYETLPNGNKRFVADENTVVFRTLANNVMTYTGKIINNYNTVIGEEERKENVTISGEATYRKYAKAEYDELNGSISLMAGQINGQNTKIAQIQVSVDEINQKIGEVTDITVTAEDTDGQVKLDSVNESEPIQIKIHPIVTNIGYDYPCNDYPQNDYPKIRILRFTRSYTEAGEQKTQIIDYELPYNLLYYDQDNYDEFYLDYDSATCYITKKCVYNSDGTVGLLSTPQVIDIDPYPTINLGSGDYTVCLLGYSQAYLFVRLMASNIYTTQFATKVELQSEIGQTKDYVDISASQKVGKDEVINRINVSLEGVLIQANKINIQGVLQAINNDTTTTINGNKITTGSIIADQIATGAITASKVSSDIITTANFSAQNINADKITAGSINASNGVTIGGFTIGNYSLYGSTTNGTMTIQRGGSASIDFPANGGRLMLGSTANNGVALTTASHLVISDSYGHTDTGDSNASVGIRAINGNIRIATNNSLQLVPSSNLYINGYYGITGQSGFKDSNGDNIYIAFWKGILVGASRSAFSTATFPWLA